MSALPVIAIFDIGKTNKKFFLLDYNYQIKLENSVTLSEIIDEDGDSCEDVQALSKWVTGTFTQILKDKNFAIKAINFSAYGASLVHVDSSGKIVAPLYNYLKKYPVSLQADFFKKYGGEEKLSCETASPVLGSLNSGLQLYRLMMENPSVFNRIQYALHLPQYISYLITGKMMSDITSIGCHTLLWNFTQNKYHRWVSEEGLEEKLAPVTPSDKTFNITFANRTLEAGAGLHDSSAALIPYLAVFKDAFILISTGTWCISLNPFNKTALTDEELKNDCLCYLDYFGTPVKASRLFAGYLHEQQVNRLAKHFDKPADFYKNISYDASVIQSLKNVKLIKNFSENNKNSFPGFDFEQKLLTQFKSYEAAYHCLIHNIVAQQVISTNLVITSGTLRRIFVDGGFSNNTIYMHLLASAFPQFEIYAASVAQATAMGAALAIHSSWNPGPMPADMVTITYYKSEL